jgi:DnaJ-class molecular chaperone
VRLALWLVSTSRTSPSSIWKTLEAGTPFFTASSARYFLKCGLAALGDKVELQTLDGKIELKIPAGTQSGKVLKVANKGTEVLNSGGRRGDLLVTVRVLVPQKLSKRETELIEELAKIQGTSLKHNETLWEHIKKNW